MSLTYPTSWRRYITNPVTGNVYKDHEGNYLYMIYGMNNAKDYIKYVNTLALDNPNISIQDEDTTKYLISALKNLNLYDSVELLWTAQAGILQRVDGLLKYLSTGYDMTPDSLGDYGDNDLTQSTESQQPRLVGGIAPNSKPAAANLNGEGRCFTHPEISFAANEAWSVTVVLNYNGNTTTCYIANNNDASNLIGVQNGMGFHYLVELNNTPYTSNDNKTTKILGKCAVLSYVYTGDTLNVYHNGILDYTTEANGTFVLSRLFTPYSLREFKGLINAYLIQSTALTATQVADLHTTLRGLYPEIESVDIGTQTWATRNFEAIATPMGNIIANVTENGAVEKYSGFTSIGAGWINNGDGSYTATGSGSGNDLLLGQTLAFLPFRKCFKISIKIENRTAGRFLFYDGYTGSNAYPIVGSVPLSGYISGNGDFIYLYKSTSSSYSSMLYANANRGFNGKISNVSFKELNWSDATEIYDAVYAATSGTAEEKEYAALKEAAMWAYHTNSVDLGASYGKIYNGYGKDLLVDDIALQADWGYHVATESELTTLAALDGLTLKYGGDDYWTTDNGTNTTGLTALGCASRDTDGTFNTIKATASFWCADSDKVLTIYDDGTAAIEAKDKTFGAYIRLVKD